MVEPTRPLPQDQAPGGSGVAAQAGDGAGFMSRWSRRKADVRSGVPVADLPAPPQGPSPKDIAAKASGEAVAGLEATQVARASTDATTPAVPEAPPLTLQDAHSLRPESDFKPFLAKSVSPEVKNAAMKKLWADPHYNIMDRLDTYIDDYSKPDPIPPELLRKLVSAQFLDLFDEEKNRKKAEAELEARHLAAQQSDSDVNATESATAQSNASIPTQTLGLTGQSAGAADLNPPDEVSSTASAMISDPIFPPSSAASTDGLAPGPVAH